MLGWCKTGVGPVSIPARGKVTFQVHVTDGGWKQLKIGLAWFDAPDRKGTAAVAWCRPIDRKDAGLKE
jgi:hypothetical protein